jgi:hypothetical protein
MNWTDSRKFRLRNRRLIQNLDNLFGINYNTRVSEENPNLAASRLVRDCRYLGLNFLAAVKADLDAGAYAVVHI